MIGKHYHFTRMQGMIVTVGALTALKKSTIISFGLLCHDFKMHVNTNLYRPFAYGPTPKQN